MVYNALQQKLYTVFKEEFQKSAKSWKEFLDEKDLGIRYITFADVVTFEVLDKKKWAYARLKYAI